MKRMSVVQRRMSSDSSILLDGLNDYNNKVGMVDRLMSGDTNCLVGQRKLDRSCGLENKLCMNLLRKHNSSIANFSDEYFTDPVIEVLDDVRKQIDFKAECDNLVSNGNQKINIRKPLAPIKNGINLSLSCTTKKNIHVQSSKTNVLNRDKQCSINFDLQTHDSTDLPKGAYSPVLKQKFGRRLVFSKSMDSVRNTNLCTSEEITVLKPRKPTDSSPENCLHHLPRIRPRVVQRYSFPPTKLTGSNINDIPKITNYNNLNSRDVGVNKYNLKNSYNGDSNDYNTLCCSYSDDDYEDDSDHECDRLSYAVQELSVNQNICRYLDSLENVESNI